jgi:macrolide-specific efflux system membrane fusion protein
VKKIFTFLKKTILSIFAFLKRRWKLTLIILIILLGAGGNQVYQAEKNKPQLTFEKVERRDITKTLEISGVVEAKQKARLRFLAGGKLTYLGFEAGDMVKRWQTIAQIDTSTLQKQLQRDLNLYMKERWDFESDTEDYVYTQEDLDTRRTLDQTQWDLENSVLNVEIRDIAIRESALYAPFDGILVHVPTNTSGVQLAATDYFEIVDPISLIFLAGVDEADINLVKIGQEAEITIDAFEDEEFTSQVEYISYLSSQSSTGTVFAVEFKLHDPNMEKMKLGMNGDAEIKLAQKENVLAVPFLATRERDGKVYVDIKTTENETQEREIKIGLETDDWLEVISGLDEGDEILIPE